LKGSEIKDSKLDYKRKRSKKRLQNNHNLAKNTKEAEQNGFISV